MKKLKLLILCFTLFITACSPQSIKNNNGKINIVATIFPQYDFARQIAKDNANIELLLPLGSDSHSYDPTPQDIIKIQDSDIFIYTGGESDTWINDILTSIDTSKTKIVKLVDVCTPIYQDEHNHHTVDEHFWTSPENAMLICNAINTALCEVDSKNAATYNKNNENYQNELKTLDENFKSVVNNANRKKLVFADRFPFRYFVAAYGLEYISPFTGCSHDAEPSLDTVKSIIDTIKQEQIKVVFYTDGSNHNIADTVSQETGAKKLLFHSCHNIKKEEFDQGITYLELMKNNLIALEEALN